MPLTQVFVSISDPRSARHKRHDLAELLTVAVCAVLSGVDDFVDIELWGDAKIDWLRGFMKLVSPTGTLEPVDDRHNGATA